MTDNILGKWTPSPYLKQEWDKLVMLSNSMVGNGEDSELWMNLLKREKTNSVDCAHSDIENSEEYTNSSFSKKPSNSSSASFEDFDDDQKEPSYSQIQQISLLVKNISELLDTESVIPDHLRESIFALSPSASFQLLTELQQHLSEQGVINLCHSLTDPEAEENWINVSLVFQLILLPRFREKLDDFDLINLMAEKYPSECVSMFLQPLLLTGEKESHTALTNLVPLLPRNDILLLMEHFIDHCTAPLEEWQLDILNLMIDKANSDLLPEVLSSVLNSLLLLLKDSANGLSNSEAFAHLLLGVIQHVPPTISQAARNDLLTLGQSNQSYCKHTIQKALKSLL